MRPEFIQSAARRVAERRILDAMDQGLFDNLPGQGKPLPDLDQPWDEHRWVRNWLKRQQLDQGKAVAELNALVQARRAEREFTGGKGRS